MAIGKKQAFIIIGVFVAGLAAFSAAYVKTQLGTNTAPSGRPLTSAPTEPKPSGELASMRHPSDDYQIIGRRNLFAHPVDKAGSGAAGAASKSGKARFPGAPGTSLPPFMASGMGMPGGPGGMGSGQSPPIAATGIVHLNGSPYVLLEKVDKGESTLVRVGERAFGYTLVSVVGEQVTLSGMQGILTLALGQNKQEKVEKPPEPAKAGESAEKPKTPEDAGRMGKAEMGPLPQATFSFESPPMQSGRRGRRNRVRSP